MSNEKALIERLKHEVRMIAVVGASDKPHRASHRGMEFLLRHGYTVVPVNPKLEGQNLLGCPVVASLADIAGPIDMVDIFRNSKDAGAAVDEAIAVGAKSVWMQLGVINECAHPISRIR